VDFVGTGTTQRMVVIEPVVGECCIEKQFDAPRTGGVAETVVLSANLLSTVDCWKGLNARLGAADLCLLPFLSTSMRSESI
jgi:hypothetical protein